MAIMYPEYRPLTQSCVRPLRTRVACRAVKALYYLASAGGLEWREEDPPAMHTDVLPFATAAERLPGAGFKPVFVRDPIDLE